MNLSDPYMENKVIITVKGESIKSVNDLNGKKGWRKYNLEEGQVDAIIRDNIVDQYHINSNNKKELTILSDILNKENHVNEFRKGDIALHSKFLLDCSNM
ncbi:hypothetical protein PIROE2DRAFT_5982 [Piromyces sp. E2]|nr:hypothetical protein PIROE2DRAFT_5982 [Piromyces sp. E2]|eukprot:OUM66769.1 hypothetical protein PIROE2DRAFT_5982 [Piromyces sp. E2]